jgi:hypothetical protein
MRISHPSGRAGCRARQPGLHDSLPAHHAGNIGQLADPRQGLPERGCCARKLPGGPP